MYVRVKYDESDSKVEEKRIVRIYFNQGRQDNMVCTLIILNWTF